MIRDRYRIGRVLGKPGGFGITYLAFDERLHTRVAVKEYMPRDVAGRATSDGSEVWSSGGHEETFQHGLDQFLREARTLAQFDHPNVVGVSNYFETNGTGYLVMDYYEGTTVHQHLAAQPDGWMDPERASEIIQEVANGLREVHAEGYLHRDIKPSNIYLTQDGRPILIDFGAARAALGEHSQNMSVLVTPGYAPYEQYRLRGDQGPHTDVYSCAATLYRMVTGTVPEPASERIVDDKLKPPRALNPAVPPELSTVIEEAMAVQGENRPPTATALQRRLRAVTYEGRKEPQQEGRRVAEEETSSSTTSSRKTGTSTSSEAPQWATTLLGMLVLVALGLGGWAEYRYGLVGLFPEGTASGTTSVIADAGGEMTSDGNKGTSDEEESEPEAESEETAEGTEPVGLSKEEQSERMVPPTEKETTVPGAEAKPESEQSADQQELNEESGDPGLGTRGEALIAGLDRKIKRAPLPRYTENVNARIQVKITVNPEGRIVRRIPLKKGSPKLEAAVMDALQRWRFNALPSGAPQENQTAIIGFTFGDEAGSAIPDSLFREFKTELYGNILSNCRILFATTPSRSPDDLSRADSIALLNGEVADELRSKDLRVVVRYAPTENGAMYGLFSKRTGTLEEMKKRKKELTDIVDAGPVLCF